MYSSWGKLKLECDCDELWVMQKSQGKRNILEDMTDMKGIAVAE